MEALRSLQKVVGPGRSGTAGGPPRGRHHSGRDLSRWHSEEGRARGRAPAARAPIGPDRPCRHRPDGSRGQDEEEQSRGAPPLAVPPLGIERQAPDKGRCRRTGRKSAREKVRQGELECSGKEPGGPSRTSPASRAAGPQGTGRGSRFGAQQPLKPVPAGPRPMETMLRQRPLIALRHKDDPPLASTKALICACNPGDPIGDGDRGRKHGHQRGPEPQAPQHGWDRNGSEPLPPPANGSEPLPPPGADGWFSWCSGGHNGSCRVVFLQGDSQQEGQEVEGASSVQRHTRYGVVLGRTKERMGCSHQKLRPSAW